MGDIVLSVNGQTVQDESGFSQSISQVQPQQPVTMTILRNGTEMTVNANAPRASQIKTLQAEVKTLKSQVKQLPGQ